MSVLPFSASTIASDAQAAMGDKLPDYKLPMEALTNPSASEAHHAAVVGNNLAGIQLPSDGQHRGGEEEANATATRCH